MQRVNQRWVKTAKGRKKKSKYNTQEGPKKPLSAYNLFFKYQRKVMLESLPVRPEGKPRRSHGKIGFAEMARVIGPRWRALTEEERAPYDRLASQDKTRYQKELQERNAKPVIVAPQSEPELLEIEDLHAQPNNARPGTSYMGDCAGCTSNLNTVEINTGQQLIPSRLYFQNLPQAAAVAPVDPFETNNDYEPYDYRPLIFKDDMKRMAQELDPYLMDRFIKAFR